MKNKLNLIFLICFLFIASVILAQKKYSKTDLLGEWYYGISNDTIILEKGTKNPTEFTKWIFKDSNEFICESIIHGKYGIHGRSDGDTWYFNGNQIEIVRGKSRLYRIISNTNSIVRLIEIK